MPAYQNLRALIVEDNTHMRTLLRTLLGGVGLKDVVEARDGEEGLGCLARMPVDLVVSDLAMAPMDGIEFTRRLREHGENPFLPVIMVSGHTSRAMVMAARDAGVTEFVAKPVTARALCLRIAEIVDRPRPFVRSDVYFGPDRRRHNDAFHMGPFRREEDRARALVEV